MGEREHTVASGKRIVSRVGGASKRQPFTPAWPHQRNGPGREMKVLGVPPAAEEQHPDDANALVGLYCHAHRYLAFTKCP